MTVQEYADQQGISPSTVYRKIRKGEIAAVKVGRSWVVQASPPPRPDPVPQDGGQQLETYDPEKHLLLRDQAHKHRIFRPSEVREFVDRVKAEGYDPDAPREQLEVFDVLVPEWPPAPRSPLALVLALSGGQTTGPFDDKPWVGVHPACRASFWGRNATNDVGRLMVPYERENEHDRVAYMWQVRCFNPTRYIPARHWALANGVDEAEFFLGLDPSGLVDLIVETVNPYLLEELEGGQFTPTRRCFRKSDLERFDDHYLGGRPSQFPRIPDWPGWDYDHHADDPDEPPTEYQPEDRLAPRAPPVPVPTVPDPQGADLVRGAKPYESWRVQVLLREALGDHFRVFGRQAADSHILAVTPEALQQFLQREKTDTRTYVADVGGRNFDCDDFATVLRASFVRRGVNACGIIHGDVHAWNVVLVETGQDLPEVVHIEPQTDGTVTQLEGQYRVRQRAEVYI